MKSIQIEPSQAGPEKDEWKKGNLEKLHGKLSLINQIIINGVETENPQIISNFCSNFYSNLYKSKDGQHLTTAFLDSPNVKQISQEDRKFCDEVIVLLESTFATDHHNCLELFGLSAECYQAYSEALASFLLEVILQSIVKGTLRPSLMESLIALRITCLLITGAYWLQNLWLIKC